EVVGKRPPPAMPDVSFASEESESNPPPTESAPPPQLIPPDEKPPEKPARVVLDATEEVTR
ncbi:MAG: hypothetical protein IT428_16360, partial [Planctomycetaceae bacterium]|nr:hypothetical protein [Planctomycetaceae bacterium]